MRHYILLIRPKQWIKNMFVLIPLFFAGRLNHFSDVVSSLVAMFAFCLVASSVYCFNDIVDAEADRRHPVKCRRPVASGAVGVTEAYLLMGIMVLLSAFTLLSGSNLGYLDRLPLLRLSAVIGGYWLLNLAYCAKLKQYAIVDVCIVSFGFVLRIFAGGVAIGVVLSHWLVLMTFLLTLFLSFAKRRDDVLRMKQTGEAPRTNTIRYNLTFINQAITITAAVTLVCYIMYTVSPEVVSRFRTGYLYVTSFFVLLGLLRYIQVAVVDEKSGDPTKVMLRDRFMQVVVLLWALSFAFIIYF